MISQTSLANSQPAPWQSEQTLRPALTIKKGSVGIARPEALQRLQPLKENNAGRVFSNQSSLQPF